MVTVLVKKLKATEDFLACTLKLKDALEKEDSKTTAALLEKRAELIAVIEAMDGRLARGLTSFPGERNLKTCGCWKNIGRDKRQIETRLCRKRRMRRPRRPQGRRIDERTCDAELGRKRIEGLCPPRGTKPEVYGHSNLIRMEKKGVKE